MRWMFLASAAALIAAGLDAAAALETGDAGRGQTVARDVCSGCHAVERNIASSPNPRAPTFRTIAGTPGMTDLALYAAVRTPHYDMPPLLPDVADVRSVVAYIRSLQDEER